MTESSATWRAIFFFQAGLGFFFVILGWMVLAKEQTVPLYTKGIDWGGAFLSTAGFGLMTYSLAYAFHVQRSYYFYLPIKRKQGFYHGTQRLVHPPNSEPAVCIIRASCTFPILRALARGQKPVRTYANEHVASPRCQNGQCYHFSVFRMVWIFRFAISATPHRLCTGGLSIRWHISPRSSAYFSTSCYRLRRSQRSHHSATNKLNCSVPLKHPFISSLWQWLVSASM